MLSSFWYAHLLDFHRIFEEQHVAACSFSEEFCANLRNVSTNRKRELLSKVFRRVCQSENVLVFIG
jgi:hypothetical protein